MKIGATLSQFHWCNHWWEFSSCKMFHFSSDRKATKNVLMWDKKLCKNNRMISSPTKYVNGICKHIENTKIKRSLNQNNTINLLAPLHSMNTHLENITHSRKNNYFSNESNKIIYYCIKIIAQDTYCILEFLRNSLLKLCWEWEISLWKHMLFN